MTTEIRPPAAHQRPSGKLYLGARQYNLVDSVVTLVELDTIPAGFTDGIEDTANHRITPGVAGFYDIIGNVIFLGTVPSRHFLTLVRLNGASTIIRACNQSSKLVELSVNAHALYYLSDTDYLEMNVVSYSGDNTIDIHENEEYTFLSVQRVR